MEEWGGREGGERGKQLYLNARAPQLQAATKPNE